MNLEDVIEPEYGLQQDEWSLSRPRFGKEQQLEVVGWSGKATFSGLERGKPRNYTYKLYVVKCIKCACDHELFGLGYFKSLKKALTSGQLPCGCSGSTRYSAEQYELRCSRKAKELGYEFLGFCGDWNGVNTKVRLVCEEHGEWTTCSVNGLVNSGSRCRRCGDKAWARNRGSRGRKPDNIIIQSFFESGAYHPDTKFWRSDREDTCRGKPYWYMLCGVCQETAESHNSSLRRGCIPCGCNNNQQRECYINWIVDDHNNAVAIKFGIAKNSSVRIRDQNRVSVYEIRNYLVYIFSTTESCRAAERECKQTLECGVLSKEEMPDGYTETTSVLNLGRIKRIYEKHGGVLNK